MAARDAIAQGPAMNHSGRGHRMALAAGLLGAATIAGLRLLARQVDSSPPADPAAHLHASRVIVSPAQQVPTYPYVELSDDVLELPAASPDFVGFWGGRVRSADSPAEHRESRVAVVFGRSGDRVFFASQLYSPPGQRILHKPRAAIISPKAVTIEYQAEGREIDYRYSHRFTLLASGRMAYKETARLYDKRDHHLVAIAEADSLMSRLKTVRQWRHFARPAHGDVREGGISASRRVAADASALTAPLRASAPGPPAARAALKRRVDPISQAPSGLRGGSAANKSWSRRISTGLAR